MINSILLVVAFLVAVITYLEFRRLKKRLDILEIALAKKNLLTWDDPALEMNKEDKKLLKELNK